MFVSVLHWFAGRRCFSVVNKNILDSQLFSAGAKVAKSLSRSDAKSHMKPVSGEFSFLVCSNFWNPTKFLTLKNIYIYSAMVSPTVTHNRQRDTLPQRGVSNMSAVIQDASGMPILT